MKKALALGLLLLLMGAPVAVAQSGGQMQWQCAPGSWCPVGTSYPIPIQSYSDRAVSTPTVQASAYASGNCVGGTGVSGHNFPSVTFQGTGPITLLNTVDLFSQGGGVEALTLYIFDQEPVNSTCTDKSTFTLSTSDTAKLLIAPFSLTLAAPTGATQSFASATNLGRISKSGATTLWYGIVSGGTFTPGSASDLSVAFQVLQRNQ